MLPCAQLTEDEISGVAKLEGEIETHVRAQMKRNGIVLETDETRGAVIIEVTQRLRAAGYQTQWQPKIEQNRFNQAVQKLAGYTLILAPTDEAYRAAAAAQLS